MSIEKKKTILFQFLSSDLIWATIVPFFYSFSRENSLKKPFLWSFLSLTRVALDSLSFQINLEYRSQRLIIQSSKSKYNTEFKLHFFYVAFPITFCLNCRILLNPMRYNLSLSTRTGSRIYLEIRMKQEDGLELRESSTVHNHRLFHLVELTWILFLFTTKPSKC